ncbi:MAG: winged helix-turn-helix transcriptional regulator [Thermodesulfobacteriota bacterium]|nr:winged helix-turn-helix transcriptional regulator [Thermodesulfobacteriota bacterium]
MDNQDLRTLKILEEIDKDKTPSQRYLAGKLNISLGLVNSFVKRLAQKGLFKIKNIPKNRVKYILTPKGAAEKTRLTYQYIQYSFQFYKSARQKLRVLFSGLTKNGNQKIVFYGSGDLAEIAYISLKETPLELVAVVDDNKAGEIFMDFVITDPDYLSTIYFDKIIITSVEERENILQTILKNGISLSKVAMME